MAISVLCNIPTSFWPEHHVSLPYGIADLTLLLYALPLIFRGNFFHKCKSRQSLNFAHSNPVLDVTAASHLPPEYVLSPRYEKSFTVSTSS